ncbi:hypothetical protein [Euzebya pacifica]|uniref:hypothetical protein n=1 Tax=Euzebya pacifica TaxID=1608957 RepID=UPI0013DED4CF|nr:hypothetical protein [Euzebya pacifica]
MNDADCVDLPIRLHPEIAAAIDSAAAVVGADVDQFVTDALVAYAGSPASVLVNGLPVGRVRVFRVPVTARDGLLAAGSSGSMAAAREAVRRAVVATLVIAASSDGSLAA